MNLERGVETDGKFMPTTGMSQRHVHQILLVSGEQTECSFTDPSQVQSGKQQGGLKLTRRDIHLHTSDL